MPGIPFIVSKKCFKNKVIGYSCAAALVLLAKFLTDLVNQGHYNLDWYARLIMYLPMILFYYFAILLIWFTYIMNKYYIDIYENYIEGKAKKDGKVVYFHIKSSCIMRVFSNAENFTITFTDSLDNTYELPLHFLYFHDAYKYLMTLD